MRSASTCDGGVTLFADEALSIRDNKHVWLEDMVGRVLVFESNMIVFESNMNVFESNMIVFESDMIFFVDSRWADLFFVVRVIADACTRTDVEQVLDMGPDEDAALLKKRRFTLQQTHTHRHRPHPPTHTHPPLNIPSSLLLPLTFSCSVQHWDAKKKKFIQVQSSELRNKVCLRRC